MVRSDYLCMAVWMRLPDGTSRTHVDKATGDFQMSDW